MRANNLSALMVSLFRKKKTVPAYFVAYSKKMQLQQNGTLVRREDHSTLLASDAPRRWRARRPLASRVAER